MAVAPFRVYSDFFQTNACMHEAHSRKNFNRAASYIVIIIKLNTRPWMAAWFFKSGYIGLLWLATCILLAIHAWVLLTYMHICNIATVAS